MMASSQLLHSHLASLPSVIPPSHTVVNHRHPARLHPPHRDPHRHQQAVEAVVVAQLGRFHLPAARFAVFVHRLTTGATAVRGHPCIASRQVTEQYPRLLVAALPVHAHPHAQCTRAAPARAPCSTMAAHRVAPARVWHRR